MVAERFPHEHLAKIIDGAPNHRSVELKISDNTTFGIFSPL